eukprot:6096539-Amphidinium_carterae.1
MHSPSNLLVRLTLSSARVAETATGLKSMVVWLLVARFVEQTKALHYEYSILGARKALAVKGSHKLSSHESREASELCCSSDSGIQTCPER